MSDSKIYGGQIIDVVEEDLPRIQKVLAGVSGGWQKAVGRALSRAGTSARTVAKGAVTKEYAISAGDFLRETRNINHFVRTSSDGVEVVFGFAGNVIPLLRFDTSVGRDGRVTSRVKRSGAKKAIDHAFRAQMGAHTGIYERIGPDRFPVRELYGPSTPQMMYSNEDVMDKVEDKMVDTYDKRIDHEINRLLAGLGG